VKRRDGNRLYYSANQNHPIFSEIQALVVKTVGLLDVLKDALTGEREIRVAFVFCSLAGDSEKAESDIDLMVIGDIGLRSLTRVLHGLTEKLGREINPYILTPKEFSFRKTENEHFLTRVLKDSKLFIIGDENDLKAMV
jgi:predicted nucleotidyltransferase